MGDQGSVEITLEGEDTHVIASASQRFSGPVSSWTLATVPLTYVSTDTPAYVTMRFTLHADSIYHYGTRFHVDDINHYGTAGINHLLTTQILECYPVPAENELTVVLPEEHRTGHAALIITDAVGRAMEHEDISIPGNGHIQLNTSWLPKGAYFLQVVVGGVRMTGKFVK